LGDHTFQATDCTAISLTARENAYKTHRTSSTAENGKEGGRGIGRERGSK